jgi:hypothetical protein
MPAETEPTADHATDLATPAVWHELTPSRRLVIAVLVLLSFCLPVWLAFTSVVDPVKEAVAGTCLAFKVAPDHEVGWVNETCALYGSATVIIIGGLSLIAAACLTRFVWLTLRLNLTVMPVRHQNDWKTSRTWMAVTAVLCAASVCAMLYVLAKSRFDAGPAWSLIQLVAEALR